MFAAIIAHFGLALLLPWLVRRFGRAAFAIAAVLPAATLGWVLTAAAWLLRCGWCCGGSSTPRR